VKRRVAAAAVLGAALLTLVTVPSCDLFPSGDSIEFPPVGNLYISYGTMDTVVDAVTLLAEGGAPEGGYTWSLASGSQFPTGTTVDPLTGVFHPTGGLIAVQPATFKMKVTAGSKSGEGTFHVVTMNYGSGPIPSAILQQWDPYGVDPSALELADATAGEGYGASLFCLGGTPPYHWSEDLTYAAGTRLSTVGLAVNATTGVVWGEPFASAAGTTVRFRVIITDAEGDTAVFQPVYTISVN
jgi:hypothetical protein